MPRIVLYYNDYIVQCTQKHIQFKKQTKKTSNLIHKVLVQSFILTKQDPHHATTA